MEQYKTCTKCKQILALDNFSKHNGKKSSKSGLRASCKNCELEANRAYRKANRDKVNAAKRLWASENKDKKANQDKRYREANAEKIAAKNKAWRENNKDYVTAKSASYRLLNREAKAATDKKWAEANKDKVNESSRRWRLNNPDRAREVARRSRSKYPETARNKTAKRRALVRENGAFAVTRKEIARLLLGTCAYCPSPAEHLDHIIPISRGGRHSIGNLTGACAPCNLSKGSKFITEWKKGKR